MTTTTRTNLAEVVDHLGTTRSVVSDLTDVIDTCKAFIIEAAAETGERAFEGQLFRATVSFSDKRVTDWHAVLCDLVAAYGIPNDVLTTVVRARTSVAEGVPCVRVAARKGV